MITFQKLEDGTNCTLNIDGFKEDGIGRITNGTHTISWHQPFGTWAVHFNDTPLFTTSNVAFIEEQFKTPPPPRNEVAEWYGGKFLGLVTKAVDDIINERRLVDSQALDDLKDEIVTDTESMVKEILDNTDFEVTNIEIRAY